jgi:hypothetical protein
MKKIYRNKNKSFRVFKSICILWLAQVLFSSCAGPLFISEEKWKLKHLVYFKVNQTDITASNKSGEKLKLYPVNEYVAVYIPTLRPRDLKITLSHPNRLDTTIKIKRTIRPGALFFDCTFGAILTGIPLLVDLVNKNIYQIKKSSRILSINMLYNNQFYDQKFKEAEKNGSITSYENFIKNFPESKLVVKAQEQVYNIAWNNAQSKNTISAYESFISKYPNSPKVDEAKRIKNKAKEIDDAYFNTIKTNKYIAYKSFLENYKNSKYNTEIAEKMANAYCEENKGSLNNLKQCNDAVKFVKDIQTVNKITANKLTTIENKRDELLAKEIQKVKSKTEYFNLLINQYKTESGKNFASEQDAEGIRYRVFTRGLNLSGMFAYWNTDGTKVVVNYANGKEQGVYTKYAADEKTILEKGMYNNSGKTGLYVINYASGKKHYEQNWNNGSLDNETEYDEQGKNLTLLREEATKKAEADRIVEEKRKEEEIEKIKLTWKDPLSELKKCSSFSSFKNWIYNWEKIYIGKLIKISTLKNSQNRDAETINVMHEFITLNDGIQKGSARVWLQRIATKNDLSDSDITNLINLWDEAHDRTEEYYQRNIKMQ